MKLTVREAEPGDKAVWRQLWRGYQHFYEADLRAGEETLWARLMDPAADGPFCFVAVRPDGSLIGLTHFLYHMTTWSDKPRCYLNDLYTAEAARGEGAGRALIEAVYARADRDGASQVYWLTQEFNQPARRLYDGVATLTPFIKYIR